MGSANGKIVGGGKEGLPGTSRTNKDWIIRNLSLTSSRGQRYDRTTVDMGI